MYFLKNIGIDHEITKDFNHFSYIYIYHLFYFCTNLRKPLAVAIGANLINLQGDDVNSNLNLGAPALSLSGYLTSGFSVGVKYGIGKAEPQDNVKRDYSYLDGIIRYNLSEENTVPYLFGGYGLSRFADGADKRGMFLQENLVEQLSGIGVTFLLVTK